MCLDLKELLRKLEPFEDRKAQLEPSRHGQLKGNVSCRLVKLELWGSSLSWVQWTRKP